MFTEFEIISIGIAFLAGFIILCLHEMLSVCKSERDRYYTMYYHQRREWSEEFDLRVEYQTKYEQLLKNFQRYVTEYKLQEKEKEDGQ